MATIYIIKNKINNKCYIGQCMCSVKQRFENHKHDSNRTISLHADMDLYGADNFYYEIIDTCADDVRLDVETYYIDKFNTLMPNGYNVYRHSSNGFSNKNHTTCGIDKISKASKKWWNSASELEILMRNKKISDKLKGIKFSDDHKKKISDNAKLRTGNKNPFYGKKHSLESIRKMQLAQSKRIYQRLDAEYNLLQEYDTIEDVYQWIVKNNLTNAKKQSIQYRIFATVEGRQQSAYGYRWSSRECNDYPNGGEIPQ